MSDGQFVDSVPVVDFDQTFPVMVDHGDLARDSATAPGDVGPQVSAVLRDLLGWRPRVEDPKAFVDALTASFHLKSVQGHVVATFVPRGYAVQADLGAVSGGQASLYRRASVLRAEMLRILDGLTPLRTDADIQDMEAYRTMVRSAITQAVDELGTAGGPRVEVVDNYFVSLTGTENPAPCTTPDTVGGQLGALRDRFGLLDANVNTVEEEGVRTSFWTLVDMVVDLQGAWAAQRKNFVGGAGQGFIGTELILLSRLMEATADQVDELERVLDSVLISRAERRTLIVVPETRLTLDGLFLWMRAFLTDEGRRIAEGTGRDGIVAALNPTLAKLQVTFKTFADWVKKPSPTPGTPGVSGSILRPPPPPGLQSARARIAVESTSGLLRDLVNAARRIGRFPAVVLTNVVISKVDRRDRIFEIQVRGFNLRPTYIPAFTKRCLAAGTPLEELDLKDDIIYPLADSATADDDTLVAFFRIDDIPLLLLPLFPKAAQELIASADTATTGGNWSVNLPAEDLPLVILDGEVGTVIYAPAPLTWPALREANDPLGWHKNPTKRWDGVVRADRFSNVPACAITVPDPTVIPPSDTTKQDATAQAGPSGGNGERPPVEEPVHRFVESPTHSATKSSVPPSRGPQTSKSKAAGRKAPAKSAGAKKTQSSTR